MSNIGISDDFKVIDSTQGSEKQTEEIYQHKLDYKMTTKNGINYQTEPEINSTSHSSDDLIENKCSSFKNENTLVFKNNSHNEEAGSYPPTDVSSSSETQKQVQYALIITAKDEEDLDVTTTDEVVNENKVGNASTEEVGTTKRDDNDKSVSQIKTPEDIKTKKKTAAKVKESSSHVWVSNIAKTVKAADLKKIFAYHSKVTSAKIVTDGKNFFGYICLDSVDAADKCLKILNNSRFEGQKIVVSRQRPDLNKECDHEVSKKSSITFKRTVEVENLALRPERKRDESKYKLLVQEEEIKRLNRALSDARVELNRFKRQLNACQRKRFLAENKCKSLQRDLQKSNDQLSSARIRLNQERERLEKNRKLDQTKFEEDRAMLNKEIDECKKLREHLQSKLNDSRFKKKRKYRTSSPIVRRESPIRCSSPKISRIKAEKRMYKDKERIRVPSPPSKLSVVVSSSRRRERSPEARQHFSSKYKKTARSRGSTPTPVMNYIPIHTQSTKVPVDPSMMSPAEQSRLPLWPSSYPEQMWRHSAQPPPQVYSYGGNYPFPPNIVGRDQFFYPDFGESHGNFDLGRRY